MSLRDAVTFPQCYDGTTWYSGILVTKKGPRDGQLPLIHHTEGQFYFSQRLTQDWRDRKKDGGGHRQSLDVSFYLSVFVTRNIFLSVAQPIFGTGSGFPLASI